jgi:DNA-binding MarR family transcriptional regulator
LTAELAQDASPALELALGKVTASALAELLELVARMLHSRGYAEDLFPAQWMALRYFAKAPVERRTASDLARFQGLANGPVSRTVRTLIQKGLLAKAAVQPRGRAEVLDLSDAGRKVLESDPTFELQKALATLDEADQEATARTLETVLRRVSGGPRA